MFSNVFVLCTGRCGSVTLSRAAAHFTNYTAGHETRSGLPGPARLAYPPRHIEVDNRLSWFLGRLDEEYGDTAFYVHLTRDRDATIRSFARRSGGIMAAYQGGGILMGARNLPPEDIAADYVDTVTANIAHFLRGRQHKMRFRLEQAPRDLVRLAIAIGATGDMDAALREFDTRHNATPDPNPTPTPRKDLP